MDTENWDNDSYIEEIDSLDESDDFGSEDDLYDFSVQSAPSKVERLVNMRFMMYKYIKLLTVSKFFS